MHARLIGGHKAAVTTLNVLPGREAGAPDALVSTSVDGTVAVWHPSTAAVKLPDREVAPKATFKAHDGPVLSSALIASPSDSPEAGQLHLVTSGAFHWYFLGGWVQCWPQLTPSSQSIICLQNLRKENVIFWGTPSTKSNFTRTPRPG